MPDRRSVDALARISKKDFEDYEFIFSEIKRLGDLSPEAQIARFCEDPWSSLLTLKAANGPELPLSRDGQARFVQIAVRGLKELGSEGQDHHLEVVVSALKEELSTVILGGSELTTANAHEIFASAINKLKGGYLELTYYVPCSIVVQRRAASFNIGTVTFQLRDQFIQQYETAIFKSLSAGSNNPEFIEHARARLNAFYSGYQWIACITVQPCDPQIARRRAHAGIQRALDAFKLFVGSSRARDVKQAYDLTVPSDYVDLVSSSPGSYDLRIGGAMRDAVLNDEWYQQAVSHPAWLPLQEVLRNYSNDRGNLDEIQSRFLDGMSWYSDAISEMDLGARIVKLWIAIERVLALSRVGNIAARAAVLISEAPEDFDKCSQELSIAYQRRSAIVHGSANRVSESWYEEAAKTAEEASAGALFQYLYAIKQIRHLRAPTDRKKLQAWLGRLDEIAAQHRRKPIGSNKSV